ncbi:hypothetical protein [Hathewaya massiliensis]|uniref:hypothetical protein n=1 Tax=Hathewaya massiliensis TaxID=1964382 RepID=UPI00115B5DAD|nr:hypothetical protein [Hathewaya massiliensis]
MNKRKSIVIIIVISLILILAYFLYPKTGSFDDLILSKYTKDNFTNIMFQSSSHNEDRTIKDKKKINEFLTYMSQLNLKEYKKDIPEENKETYYINIYGKDNNGMSIAVNHKNYISIYESFNNKRTKIKTYKITNKDIDMEYIKKVLN